MTESKSANVSPTRLAIYNVLIQVEEVRSALPVFYEGHLNKLITNKLLKGIVGNQLKL